MTAQHKRPWIWHCLGVRDDGNCQGNLGKDEDLVFKIKIRPDAENQSTAFQKQCRTYSFYFTKACLTQFKSKYYFHQRIIFVLPWKSTGNMLWNYLPRSRNLIILTRGGGGGRIVPSSRLVVLNWGRFCPLGNIWQRPETVWVVTTGGLGECHWHPGGRGQKCC